MNTAVRALSTFALVLVTSLATSVQAGLIDFTDSSWQAVVTGSSSTATVGDITLTASVNNLTFNANDKGGCVAGQSSHGLACLGDGIGIRNDEITQGGTQQITVTFANEVNILNVNVLDLFGSERSGETALIMKVGDSVNSYTPTAGNLGVAGGYWETGFSAFGVTELVLYSPDDGFSDYALASIEIEDSSVVAEPGSLALMAFGIIGLALMRKRLS